MSGQGAIFESVPNFSEGRREQTVRAIAAAAEGALAHVLDVHLDADHHRSVISLAGVRSHVVDGLVAAVAEARERIDLGPHAGVHPRIGAADVVPVVPLGGATLDEASAVAREVGSRIWEELRVPVYFYGHGSPRTLADIRAGRARPDLGGPAPHPTAGAVCVGARHLLVAFNVILPGFELAAARVLARSLRESAGGLRGVQALAFQLGDGRVQLSMNLFRIDEARPRDVVEELERRGVAVGRQELVGLCPARAAGPESSGALLEGRLAAAAARSGARAGAAPAGAAPAGLAPDARLEEEAAFFAGLAADVDSLVAGAERAAALGGVLRAAGVDDTELEAMVAVAAEGLSSAAAAAAEAGGP